MKQVNLTPPNSGSDRARVTRIFKTAMEKNKHILGPESFEVLKAYGIPIVESVFARTIDEAIKAAEELGYPLAMKIVSPQISHKSDVGGIKLSLKNDDEVRAAYKDMLESISQKVPDISLEGVLLQPMLSGGIEVIIGMVRDPTFGPMLMFGLGGVYVEVLKDVKFAIAPVNDKEAREMITGIKAYPLLAGIRGAKPSDIDAIIDVILKVSKLACDFSEIKEFEINPLMVFEEGKGVLAVDMRLVLKREWE
jgi:acetate---CoA ligase (ADP-forming) subunit beta